MQCQPFTKSPKTGEYTDPICKPYKITRKQYKSFDSYKTEHGCYLYAVLNNGQVIDTFYSDYLLV